MAVLRGFLVLMLFYLVGEALQRLFLLPVSGGVIGMALMTLALMVHGRIGEGLAGASQALISVLVLLIMPGVVGVFFLADEFAGQWLAVAVALGLGTLLSVVTTLLVMRALVGGRGGSASDD
ncbi:MAG: CidA/LrgA family protein [Marinobacter sp.]|uniref:CidA/LrgA family protein n=1 Tax=Marinobacter sp. TaxID=50741 RepID=UPI00299DA807|nr:CidA/LrgA family protein [Marinobacter sp.]MDX1633236.1 CidA/LrgA family protein [Marinobacter sp.]